MACRRKRAGAREKRRYFNRRRQADPLGEGHACTWRTQLIKVAAWIVVASRRVRVLISTAWPFWSHLAKVTQAVQAFRRGPLPAT